MELQEIKEKARSILKKYHVERAGIFGSYAAGTPHPSSDVDILIESTPTMTLFDFAGIKVDLEDTLGIKVDLVEYGGLKPLLKDKILRQQISIL